MSSYIDCCFYRTPMKGNVELVETLLTARREFLGKKKPDPEM